MKTERKGILAFESATPLYRQIAEHIYGQIVQGKLLPGAPLDSETDLQQAYDVSRVTLRQAIGVLVDDGVVVRKQGKGTFVENVPLQFPLGSLAGTTQLATSLGRDTKSVTVGIRVTQGNAGARRALRLSGKDRIVEILRVDFTGGQPLSYAVISLPEEIGRSVSADDVESEALYPLLERLTGLVASEAHQTLRAVEASAAIAEYLEIAAGSPVMSAVRVTQDQHGAPMEHSEIAYRADAVQFSVSLRKQRGELSAPFRFHEEIVEGDVDVP